MNLLLKYYPYVINESLSKVSNFLQYTKIRTENPETKTVAEAF
jgi:hypothetical protein